MMRKSKTRSLTRSRIILIILALSSLYYAHPSLSFTVEYQPYYQKHHHPRRRHYGPLLVLPPPSLLLFVTVPSNDDPNNDNNNNTAHNHNHNNNSHEDVELLVDDDDRKASCSSSIMISDFAPTAATNQKHPIWVNCNILLMSRRALGQHSLASLITTTAGVTASATTMACPAMTAAATTVAAASVDDDNDHFLIPTPVTTPDLYWPLGKVAFSLLPLAGTYTRRKTIETVIAPDMIWTFDQIQGIVNVNVPVRQTVVKLSNNNNNDSSNSGGGSLWVHNPVAPTLELLNMMHRLECEQNATIQHVILGTVALEHKATFCDFCQYFPHATIWIQPGQWSFPLQLPIEFLSSITQRGIKLRELPIPNVPATRPRYVYSASAAVATAAAAAENDNDNNAVDPVWLTDFDYQVLGPFQFQSVGAFSETAFYHRATKTLIVTDVVCSVTAEPPTIVQDDARALLYHARDDISEQIMTDTPELRRKGWRRMVQFGLVFFPSQIEIIPRTVSQAIQQANRNVPLNLRNLGQDAIPFGGQLYPWKWTKDDADLQNFDAIAQNGKLFCPPILTKLILDREVEATLQWVDTVVTRFGDMQRIIPGHLNNNIVTTSSNKNKKNTLARDFYEAFDPLRSRFPNDIKNQRPLAEDLALLQAASDVLTKYGIVAPSQVCDGEPARQQGRFAAATTTAAERITTTTIATTARIRLL
jgi:Domain of unknown function (DUF4336)